MPKDESRRSKPTREELLSTIPIAEILHRQVRIALGEPVVDSIGGIEIHPIPASIEIQMKAAESLLDRVLPRLKAMEVAAEISKAGSATSSETFIMAQQYARLMGYKLVPVSHPDMLTHDADEAL